MHSVNPFDYYSSKETPSYINAYPSKEISKDSLWSCPVPKSAFFSSAGNQMMRGPRLDDRVILYTPAKSSYSISFFLPSSSEKWNSPRFAKLMLQVSHHFNRRPNKAAFGETYVVKNHILRSLCYRKKGTVTPVASFFI